MDNIISELKSSLSKNLCQLNLFNRVKLSINSSTSLNLSGCLGATAIFEFGFIFLNSKNAFRINFSSFLWVLPADIKMPSGFIRVLLFLDII